MDIPQAFLLGDAILRLYMNITSDMVVYPKQIEKLLRQELPFMATEKVLMAAVRKGASRQEIHEVIKLHSVASGKMVKEEGGDNDLMARLAADPALPFSLSELEELMANPAEFAGRAEAQTEEFLAEEVAPCLERYRGLLDSALDSSLKV